MSYACPNYAHRNLTVMYPGSLEADKPLLFINLQSTAVPYQQLRAIHLYHPFSHAINSLPPIHKKLFDFMI